MKLFIIYNSGEMEIKNMDEILSIDFNFVSYIEIRKKDGSTDSYHKEEISTMLILK